MSPEMITAFAALTGTLLTFIGTITAVKAQNDKVIAVIEHRLDVLEKKLEKRKEE